MKIRKATRNFIYGIILGISNVIPGVSGGTMAVILDIYDTLLLAFTKENFQKSLPFLLPLGIGTVLGIYGFSQVITNLLEDHRILLTFGFSGIILGSIPAIFKRARYEKAKMKNISLGLLALLFMVAIAYVSSVSSWEISFFKGGTGATFFYIWLLLASLLAMIAMLLPGISGSLILLVLGAYTIAMEAIANFQWNILFTLALGVLIGGYIGIRVIQNMLKKHPQALYFIILGLVIGSLFILFQDMKGGFSSPLNYLIFFASILLSLVFGRRKNSANE